jgi:hypothetical protein
VVDERARVVGMVTRKELLHESLGERLQAAGGGSGAAGNSRAPTPETSAAHRSERSALLGSP